MNFLTWLKERNARWQKVPGFVNLANSGIAAGATDVFLRHMSDRRNEFHELLAPRYANEWGHEGLVDRIRRRYGIPAETGVLPVAGASAALSLVVQTALSAEAGAEVAVETPTYDPLFRVPRCLGGRIRWLPREPERGYGIDPCRVQDCVTPHTRLLILSSPHNPSGAVLEDAALLAIAEEASRVSPDLSILVDETYADFVPGRRPAALLGERFVSISSLSKVYGLGLLRCGWVVAAPEVYQRLRAVWLHMVNIGSKLTESLAALAFDHLEEYTAHWQRVVRANREVVRAGLDGLGGLVEGGVPQHGCVCFPQLRVRDVDLLVEQLEARWQVGVAPGRFFRAPRHVRLGFGGDTGQLEAGMRRVVEAVRAADRGAA